jgi:hypothetical protein
MHLTAILAITFLAFSSLAYAGTPTDEDVICPVGGETFTITGTRSCSTMGATMSLQQMTSCDFITRLPVCPSNGLPMYREFDDGEIERLTAFIQTDTYAALRDKSDYFRAYAVEQHLGGESDASPFWLLQSGFWYDRAAMSSEPDVMSVYLNAALKEKESVEAGDKPYFLALVAYQLGATGDVTGAKVWLEEARAATDGSDYLNQYISAVEDCLEKMNGAECGPDRPFDP